MADEDGKSETINCSLIAPRRSRILKIVHIAINPLSPLQPKYISVILCNYEDSKTMLSFSKKILFQKLFNWYFKPEKLGLKESSFIWGLLSSSASKNLVHPPTRHLFDPFLKIRRNLITSLDVAPAYFYNIIGLCENPQLWQNLNKVLSIIVTNL